MIVSISLRCPSSLFRSGMSLRSLSSLFRSGMFSALVWIRGGVGSLRVGGLTFAGDLSLVRLDKLLDVILGVEVLIGWWDLRPPCLGPNCGCVRWLEILVVLLLLGLRGRQGRWWRILSAPDRLSIRTASPPQIFARWLVFLGYSDRSDRPFGVR